VDIIVADDGSLFVSDDNAERFTGYPMVSELVHQENKR